MATILVITGSHGYLDGRLGLPDYGTYWFYDEDCKRVGVKPGPVHHDPCVSDWLRLFDWGKVPILTQSAEKFDPRDTEYRQDCFYNDDDLKTLDIRVANLGYYYGGSFKILNSKHVKRHLRIKDNLAVFLLKHSLIHCCYLKF